MGKEIVWEAFKKGMTLSGDKPYQITAVAGYNRITGLTNEIGLFYHGWEVPVGGTIQYSTKKELGLTFVIDSTSINIIGGKVYYSIGLAKGLSVSIDPKKVRWSFLPSELYYMAKTSPGEFIFFTFLNGLVNLSNTGNLKEIHPLRVLYNTVKDVPSSLADFVLNDILFLKSSWIQKLIGPEKINVEKYLEKKNWVPTRAAIKRLRAKLNDTPPWFHALVLHYEDETQRQGTAWTQLLKLTGLILTSKNLAKTKINDIINKEKGRINTNKLDTYQNKRQFQTDWMYLLYKIQPTTTNVSRKDKEDIVKVLEEKTNVLLNIYSDPIEYIGEVLNNMPEGTSKLAVLKSELVYIQSLYYLYKDAGLEIEKIGLSSVTGLMGTADMLQKLIVIEEFKEKFMQGDSTKVSERISKHFEKVESKSIDKYLQYGGSIITAGIIHKPKIGKWELINEYKKLVDVMEAYESLKGLQYKNKTGNAVSFVSEDMTDVIRKFLTAEGTGEKINKLVNFIISEAKSEMNEKRPDLNDLQKISDAITQLIKVTEKAELFSIRGPLMEIKEKVDKYIFIENRKTEIERMLPGILDRKEDTDWTSVIVELDKMKEVNEQITNKKYQLYIQKWIVEREEEIGKMIKGKEIKIDTKYLKMKIENLDNANQKIAEEIVEKLSKQEINIDTKYLKEIINKSRIIDNGVDLSDIVGGIVDYVWKKHQEEGKEIDTTSLENIVTEVITADDKTILTIQANQTMRYQIYEEIKRLVSALQNYAEYNATFKIDDPTGTIGKILSYYGIKYKYSEENKITIQPPQTTQKVTN